MCIIVKKMVNTWIRFWHFSCIIYYYRGRGSTTLLVKDIPENASLHSLVTGAVLVLGRLVAQFRISVVHHTNRLSDRRHPVGLSGLGYRGVSFSSSFSTQFSFSKSPLGQTTPSTYGTMCTPWCWGALCLQLVEGVGIVSNLITRRFVIALFENILNQNHPS